MSQRESQSSSASPEGSPRSEILLAQALFRLAPGCQALEHMRCCAHPLGVKSLFPTALCSLVCKPHWPLKLNVLGARVPGAGFPGWETHRTQTPHFLGFNLCNCDYCPLCGSPTQGLGLDHTRSPPFLSI